MTSPSPWDSISHADEQDALHQISLMLTGTKLLQNEPGVVYSLAQQKAHPADAQAIDQFMQSLDAEKRVSLARATSEQIVLSPDEQTMLQQNGVPFKDVMFTQQDAATTAVKHIMDATGGKLTAKLNADGTLALDANGNIQTEQVHHSNGGWFSSFGSFFGHLGGSIKSGALDALHGMNKAYNFVSSGFMGQYADKVPGHQITDVEDNILHNDATRAQDMQDQGYDPNSLWSSLAFGASGKAHTDLSRLNDTYGQDKVDLALNFLKDPKGYRKTLENDPSNYMQTADGQTVLTPEAASKLRFLASDQFGTLARQVNAHANTIGNAIANDMGIDPIQHSTLYGLTAGASNLAASFMIDPTLLAMKGFQVAKLSQVGIDSLADSTGAASVLTRRGMWAKNVQRGWQRGIDLGQQFRDAIAAGDTAKAAATTAQFRAELPALEPIWENFTGGSHVFQGYHATETEVVNGKIMPKALFGQSDGIRNLDDAAKFISSQSGLLRLYRGRAATQSGLMPGALSAFGYRKLKGITAGWMTERSANRALDAAQTVITRAEADPMLRAKLLDEGILRQMPAEADDAVVFHNGQVLADKAALDEAERMLSEGFAAPAGEPADFYEQMVSQAKANYTSSLASARRAAEAKAGQLEVTAAGKGEIVRNLRKTGDPLAVSSPLGLFSPTAIAERVRLAGIRLSTLLPRNTLIDITDARSGDLVYKTALTYLNRGEANTLRAMYAQASAGERKVIIQGLIDQLGHAAGLGKTETGRDIMARAKTSVETYSAADNEIELEGQRMALTEGQTRESWLLPSFQAMQKAADKIGVMEAIGGRALTGNLADTIMAQWKMGALFKPSTVSRNMLEGWLRTVLEGRAGDALKARAIATARNKELWSRGFGVEDKALYVEQRAAAEQAQRLLNSKGLTRAQRTKAYADLREAKRLMSTVENRPIVQHLIATEGGDLKLASAIERGSMLDGETLGRSVAGNWLANTAPLAAVGRAYRYLVGRHMDEETVKALMTMPPEDLQLAMEGYGQQLIAAEIGFKGAAKNATEIAKAGFGPAKVRYALHRAQQRSASGTVEGEETRWTHVAIDGTTGYDRYAETLGRLVDRMPETAKAAMAHLADREATPISEVVRAMEAESKNTAFGHVFFPDPVGAPHIARRAVSDEEAADGKLHWANKVVEEYRYLLTGRNGKFQKKLADYISTQGHSPDSDWLANNIVKDNRPDAALAPEVMAMPNGGVAGLAQTLQDVEGAAYQWMVERPLQRTTSSPVFLANYAIARKGLNREVERLVENGMSREAANNLAQDLATRNAWVKTEQLIDDPGQKTQFDVIARNIFPFARATQAMIRRWGTGLWQNPVAARKMMLAYEGAVHSGLIYTNAYGEPTFTYPGSGVMNMALRGLALVPGFENVAAFPVASDMTGGVLMSVPGADNPFRMSTGPMISIPFREVYKHLLPASWRGNAMSVDEFVNGPVGTGETFMQLVPTAVRKFYTALDSNSRNSALASAMNGAIANLAAAGLIPTPDASNAEQQQFRSRLQTQVKSQLMLRAVFGLFAPAAPSSPTEGTSASGADYAWSIDGIKQLSDEYKSILNEVGGDIGRANAVFTALHPDEVVYDPKGDLKANFLPASAYETTRSGAVSPGAYMPSTDSTLKWLDTHSAFVKRYNSVAAYFLPEQSANEPFSDAAYKAQIEFGLRQRKTPTEFMSDIYVRHAEDVFYPADHALDQKIKAAQLSGDTALAAQLTQERHDWQQQFKTLNPFFASKIDDYGSARKTASQQLSDLRQMLSDGQVPDGLGQKLGTLVKAYDNYQEFLRTHAGQDNANTDARSNALDIFNRWADQELAGTPLASVFNGVFRVLNSNFDKIGGSGA